jgi:hypothetical protein
MASNAGSELIASLREYANSNTYPYTLMLTCRRFYTSKAHSDLTIVSGDQEFKVHKIILAGSSPVFRQLLGGGFKVRMFLPPCCSQALLTIPRKLPMAQAPSN